MGEPCAVDTWIRDIVEETPLVDTHEHLLEESTRLAGRAETRLLPCDDWAYLFYSYVGCDLRSSGMSGEEQKRFFAPDTSTQDKVRLLLPAWERSRNTGYALALRHTLRDLYRVDDLSERTAPCLAERYREMIRPGFYREILLDRCNIEHCQVNSSERIFMESAQPDLLRQDIGIVPLSSGGPDLEAVERTAASEPPRWRDGSRSWTVTSRAAARAPWP